MSQPQPINWKKFAKFMGAKIVGNQGGAVCLQWKPARGESVEDDAWFSENMARRIIAATTKVLVKP